jgi:hypothetical protein
MGNVDQTFCPKLLSTKQTFDLLLFNMFIYAKVGHSKFVEMHGNASDFYRSTLVFYTEHRVNITIYLTVYLHVDMCLQMLIHNAIKK